MDLLQVGLVLVLFVGYVLEAVLDGTGWGPAGLVPVVFHGQALAAHGILEHRLMVRTLTEVGGACTASEKRPSLAGVAMETLTWEAMSGLADGVISRS